MNLSSKFPLNVSPPFPDDQIGLASVLGKGFMPKLANDASKSLDGLGAWVLGTPLTTVTFSASEILELADAFKLILWTKATPGTITFPPYADVPFVSYSQFLFYVDPAAGVPTFTPGSGVTVYPTGLSDGAPGELYAAVYLGSNKYVITGALT